MPGLDGYETSRRIRSNPALSSTKIIMVSAMGMTDDIQEGFNSGADDYLPKPFKAVEVRDRIRAQLDGG